MTDKERIEELEKPMRIYVDRLPKSCAECLMCRSGNLKLKRNGRYVEANTCVLGLFYKYHSIDDEINTCPLKTIQSIQNQKAVEALQEVKERVKALRDLEISAVRESREFDFKTEDARLEWIKMKTENSKIYNNELKIINQLISELGGKDE